jgi:hypothetical protein
MFGITYYEPVDAFLFPTEYRGTAPMQMLRWVRHNQRVQGLLPRIMLFDSHGGAARWVNKKGDPNISYDITPFHSYVEGE